MWNTFVNLTLRYPLDTISACFSLLPICVGLVFFKQLSNSMRWTIVFFCAFLLKDCVAFVHSIHGEHNLYLYNFQSFLEIVAVAVIYSISMPVQARLVGGLAAVFLTANIFFYTDQELSAGNLTIARVYMLIIVLLYMSHVLNKALIQNIVQHDMFWVSAGFLIYAAGTFFIFLFGRYLFDITTPDATFDFYWNLQEVVFIGFCIICTIGLLVSSRESGHRIVIR